MPTYEQILGIDVDRHIRPAMQAASGTSSFYSAYIQVFCYNMVNGNKRLNYDLGLFFFFSFFSSSKCGSWQNDNTLQCV